MLQATSYKLKANKLFSICQHPHKPCSLHGIFEHLLVFETHASVVALTNVTEEIDVRLHGGVVFVIDVARIVSIESASLLLHLFLLLLLLIGGHGRGAERGN